MHYKHTCDTNSTNFQGITNKIYGFGRPFFAPSFFTRPPIFLPVHIRFYLSKWRVDGSLHKAMVPALLYVEIPVKHLTMTWLFAGVVDSLLWSV